MKINLLKVLVCPKCKTDLTLTNMQTQYEEIIEGELKCSDCGKIYPVIKGIPRFVEPDNYASSFGYQWNEFKATQLDSASGTTQSADRFYSETEWTKEWLKGKWVLDAGCGAGRFLDVVSENECDIVGIDISSAIEASAKNLADRKNIHFVQAGIYDLPFRDGTFDGCYCIGVVQHTPSPQKTLESLSRIVKKGGRIAVTIYIRKPWTFLFGKYLIRPVTRRMKDETLLKAIRFVMPVAFPLTSVLFRIPILNRVFKFMIPVANYVEKKDLSRNQRYEWAVLDTFDMLSPSFDQPQTDAETEANLSRAGVKNIKKLNNPGVNMIGEKA